MTRLPSLRRHAACHCGPPVPALVLVCPQLAALPVGARGPLPPSDAQAQAAGRQLGARRAAVLPVADRRDRAARRRGRQRLRGAARRRAAHARRAAVPPRHRHRAAGARRRPGAGRHAGLARGAARVAGCAALQVQILLCAEPHAASRPSRCARCSRGTPAAERPRADRRAAALPARAPTDKRQAADRARGGAAALRRRRRRRARPRGWRWAAPGWPRGDVDRRWRWRSRPTRTTRTPRRRRCWRSS